MGCGLRSVAGVGVVQPESEVTAECGGAHGGVRWVGFCALVQGLPVSPVVLLMGPACISEARAPFLESLSSDLCTSVVPPLPFYFGFLAKHQSFSYLHCFIWWCT